MNYKIKCEVFLGISCGGMYHGDSNYLNVDLTDNEAQQIREQIDPYEDNILHQLEEQLPEIYEKVMDEVYSYVYFVVANDARESGLWQDCIQSGRDIDDFIQEDIDNGDFDNEDENGNPLPENELYRKWNQIGRAHV